MLTPILSAGTTFCYSPKKFQFRHNSTQYHIVLKQRDFIFMLILFKIEHELVLKILDTNVNSRVNLIPIVILLSGF